MTQSIGFVLLNIDPKSGTPSTQLGPLMGMEPTSLSRTLKSMDERGLIEREQDDADKRVMRVKLTQEGKRLRNISRKTVVNFNDRLLEEVDAKKLEHFKEVIQIIHQHTQKEA